jgi:Cu(I)-responsive transcriptional regulator
MSETLSIGEAARMSGVSSKMIRHYESIGLLPRAQRSNGNYRLYNAQDVHNLRFIHRARSLGFPLETIRELLALWRNRQRSSAQVKKLALVHVAGLEAKIADMQQMADALKHLAKNCQGNERPDCPILEELASNPGESRTSCHTSPESDH